MEIVEAKRKRTSRVAEMVVWRKTCGVYHNESAGINLQATIAERRCHVAHMLFRTDTWLV